jgi:IS1 family transposase
MVSMNKLSTEERAKIIACLVEGNSIRGTVRLTGFAKNTVTKLLVDLGWACSDYQDRVLVNLPSMRIQCDEIWSFCHARPKNVPADKQDTFGYGSVWTWVAIDPDTKLVPTWRVGPHDHMEGVLLLQDLHQRIPRRIQLSTDGWGSYAESVEEEYGSEIDYGQIVKNYVSDERQGVRGATISPDP